MPPRVPTYQVIEPIPFPTLTCARVTQVPQGLCITFPGGPSLCVSAGVRTGDLPAMTESLLGMINSALMPLQPFFNIIDVFVAIANCIEAIPKSLVPPSPGPIVECIKGLGEALAKLLAMLPALSVPRLVKGILLALAAAMLGVKQELQSMLVQQARIVEAATRAAEPGNLQLQTVVDCATGNFDLQMQNLNASMAPLNRMIGLINVLLKLVPNSPVVPTIADLGNDAASALNVVDDAANAMYTVANLIPVQP